MKRYRIAALPGDGIGPDVTREALLVLEAAGERFGFRCDVREALIGGCAIDILREPLPGGTLEICLDSDAVLMGAVGGPKWDALPGAQRPEAGLLRIRSELKLFANLRPAIVFGPLRSASPLKEALLGDGLDLLIVRELTGGIYFGPRGRGGDGDETIAYDTEQYKKSEIVRIGRVAFEAARKRSKRLCSVDKANVLESSRLWRETMNALAGDYPDVALSHLYVDNAAMQLVCAPRQFDTIVTSNLFGDILSDEASQIAGSIGMLPSASLGAGTLGLYEPVHGAAPDIAGKDVANPLAAILSAGMLLRHSLGETEAADAVEAAVAAVIDDGFRTIDIAKDGRSAIGTRAMGQRVREALAT